MLERTVFLNTRMRRIRIVLEPAKILLHLLHARDRQVSIRKKSFGSKKQKEKRGRFIFPPVLAARRFSTVILK